MSLNTPNIIHQYVYPPIFFKVSLIAAFCTNPTWQKTRAIQPLAANSPSNYEVPNYHIAVPVTPIILNAGMKR